jgi:curved DNA-binding protein CbpA
MIITCLQGQEYVYSAKRAGLYSHLLAYSQAVSQGLQPQNLPGEGKGSTVQPSVHQPLLQGHSMPHQQQLVQVNRGPVNHVQVLSKKKASEKALTFFQSCLKVLGIEEEVALTDALLKTAYKKAVIKAHPDRGGSEEHFEAVTRAYAYLIDILHLIQGQKGRVDKPVPELDTVKNKRKEESEKVAYVEPVRLNPKNLNLNAFNQMFEQTRVPDPDEDGYGDWLKSGDAGKKSSGGKFGKEFNRDVFNNMFEREMSGGNSSQLTIQQPEALTAYMPSGIELGRDRPPDYTAALNATTRFTDLKNAYTSDNVFSGQVANASVHARSFDSYKTERDKGPAKYSEDENASILAWQQQQEQKEKQRQLRAAQEHMLAGEYQERMKRLVLTEK